MILPQSLPARWTFLSRLRGWRGLGEVNRARATRRKIIERPAPDRLAAFDAVAEMADRTGRLHPSPDLNRVGVDPAQSHHDVNILPCYHCAGAYHPRMKVTLSSSFARELKSLAHALRAWRDDSRRELQKAYHRAGLLWQAEAKKRVPVDESRLVQGILSPPPYWNGAVLTQEVGTNIEYGVHTEFGTDRIAGGKVKRLGDRPDITDLEAVHTWPAKEADAIETTSHSIDTKGATEGRLRTKIGQFTHGPQEQMPWLRPAFQAIKDELIDGINMACEPPAKH